MQAPCCDQCRGTGLVRVTLEQVAVDQLPSLKRDHVRHRFPLQPRLEPGAPEGVPGRLSGASFPWQLFEPGLHATPAGLHVQMDGEVDFTPDSRDFGPLRSVLHGKQRCLRARLDAGSPSHTETARNAGPALGATYAAKENGRPGAITGTGLAPGRHHPAGMSGHGMKIDYVDRLNRSATVMMSR